MPTLISMQAATPRCPECVTPLRYDHDGTMWNCPGCSYQTTIESLVHRQTTDFMPLPREARVG